MKKLLFVCVVAVLTVGCNGGNAGNRDNDDSLQLGDSISLEEAESLLSQQIEQLVTDSTLTSEQVEDSLYTLFLNAYDEHQDDSLGYNIFLELISLSNSPEAILDMYDKSSELIHESETIKKQIDALKNFQKTSAGTQYIEVAGPDVLTGKPLSISDMLKLGKPVLVDFWASWCGPCRNEIKNHLLALAKTGKVNILGVAVWEESDIDTRKAMEKLGVTWPVIYSGGRDDSPTTQYGVLGIPSLVLIGTDGTIIARGHSIEEFKDKL